MSRKICSIGAYGVAMRGPEVMLIRHPAGPYLGLYGLPGDNLQFGERPELTLSRAFSDETGLDALNSSLLACSSYVASSRDGLRSYHRLGLIYSVERWAVLPDAEPSIEYGWYLPDAIENDELSPFLDQALSLGLIPTSRTEQIIGSQHKPTAPGITTLCSDEGDLDLSLNMDQFSVGDGEGESG